jgi:TetR/AcrR family transcriptional regulator
MSAPTERKRDREATRTGILATATRHFAAGGFAGTRVDEIAAEAGCNKRMIYVYFGSKEGLYLEVLRMHFDRVLEVRDLPADPSTPRDRATAVIRRYFYFLAEHPDFVRLLAWETVSGAGASSRVLARAAAGLEDLRAILRAGIADGSFRADLDVHRLMLSIHALCLGFFQLRPLAEALWNEDLSGPAELEAGLDHLLSLIFDGVGPRPLPKVRAVRRRVARKEPR